MVKEDSSVYWVIDFKKGDPNSSLLETENQGIPPFDLYIPQETVSPSRPKHQKSPYKALEFLQQIQDSCESLKQECEDTLEQKSEEPYEDQIINITEDIRLLFDIIKEFTDLMQKLQQPPDDPDIREEKNS